MQESQDLPTGLDSTYSTSTHIDLQNQVIRVQEVEKVNQKENIVCIYFKLDYFEFSRLCR